MKIIVSHDIDHYRLSDHLFKDLYIPKFLIKNTYFAASNKIPLKWYAKRMGILFSNRMSRLEELIEFNKSHGVSATFFMGVANALNLSYDLEACKEIAALMEVERIPLNVHGIAFDDFAKIQNEKKTIESISRTGDGGMRMHYLRQNGETFSLLNNAGYRYDSTEYALKSPYRVGQMMEFPVSLMEVYAMGYDETDFEKVKRHSLAVIREAESKGLSYFTLIFHDHHYSDAYPLHKAWYEWIILYFKSNNYQFCNFQEAIIETSK